MSVVRLFSLLSVVFSLLGATTLLLSAYWFDLGRISHDQIFVLPGICIFGAGLSLYLAWVSDHG